MAPDLIKIGETQDIEKRMAQHVILHKNAHLPDRPVLLQVWKGVNQKAAEKAVHGVLALRKKRYEGNGTGREWFKATVEEIEEILNFAAEGAFVKDPKALHAFEGE